MWSPMTRLWYQREIQDLLLSSMIYAEGRNWMESSMPKEKMFSFPLLLGLSLMIVWRRKKTRKGAISSRSVGVSVCVSVCVCTGYMTHFFLPRNRIFMLNDSWDTRKKSVFYFFDIFFFTLFFFAFFVFFPGHNFSNMGVIFGLRRPLTIRK